MEFLSGLDHGLFLLINSLPHPAAANGVFFLISQSVWLAWAAFFVYVFGLILVHKKNAGRGFAFLILATLSGFVLNTYGFKDFFRRSRPFVSISSAIIIEKGLSDYAFPSSHAFSVALLATLFIRKKNVFKWLALYALVVGFSRIYLGVHFPFDVLAGFAFGLVYGLSVNHFYERFLEKEEFHMLKHHVEVPQKS